MRHCNATQVTEGCHKLRPSCGNTLTRLATAALKLGVGVSACFILVLPASAHMLNMTRISVDVVNDAPSEIKVQVDLGQSLLTPTQYWEATRGSHQQLTAPAESAIARVQRGLEVLAGGSSRPLKLKDWTFSASSLAAIKNPLSPQMATLIFETDLQDANSLELILHENLEIPWPCLLSVNTSSHRLPQSRVLTQSWRSSRAVPFADSTTPLDARFVSAISSWLPEASWIGAGFQHILPLGLDHIVFVLGLFFVTTGLKSLLWQVSGFTVAHSLTLALASLGYVAAPAAWIEPLIALSIVYIGLEYLYPGRPPTMRFGIVCAFGLLHGLGFASVLQSLSLPDDNRLAALLSFNLGIELGQLTVLAAAFMLVGWFTRQSWYPRAIAQPATITISGIGMYWFLSRTLLS